jgi:hypothetical protein
VPVPDDDIIIDEDIYEDTDDYVPSVTSSYSQPAAPSLPDRNLSSITSPPLPGRNTPKHTASPAPSLPPRSGGPIAPSPGLPPRNAASAKSSVPNPQDYEATNKAAVKKPAPPPSVEDEELYDDVLVGDTGANESEEMYDDVIIGGENEDAISEDLYDDVVAVTTGATGEPIQDEFYEDMAPGTPNNPDPYVTMEKKGEGGEDELYVDVDEPAKKQQQPKQLDTAKQTNAKSSTFSRMFHKKSVSAGKMSVSLSYKAPKKARFEDKWAVIEGSSLHIYKSSSDKRAQEKISLGDFKLEMGSREAGAGKHAFRLNKGEKTHHFSFKEVTELEDWVGVVKGLVKFAVETKEGGADEEEVYEAKEDHIGDDGELTFKKGTYIRLVRRDSADKWVGQLGTEDQLFEGKIGTFPPDKVQLAEDLYI